MRGTTAVRDGTSAVNRPDPDVGHVESAGETVGARYRERHRNRTMAATKTPARLADGRGSGE